MVHTWCLTIYKKVCRRASEEPNLGRWWYRTTDEEKVLFYRKEYDVREARTQVQTWDEDVPQSAVVLR